MTTPALPASLPTSNVDLSRSYFHTLPVAVVYPLLQSAITGASLGLCASALAWFVGNERPLAIGLLVACLAQAITWLVTLSRWHRWVYKLEDVTGMDLNRDGEIGRPVEPVRVELVGDNGRSTKFIDLPAKEDQLVQLGTGLLQGTPFSEMNWTGRGAAFSKNEFRDIRNEMIRRGLLRWINPNARAQGLELTYPGRAVMTKFACMGVRPPTLVKQDPH